MAGDREQSWRRWLDSAVDSLDAAYQAATALLLYSKQPPPSERQAWSHEATPELVQNLPAPFWKQDKRNAVASRLSDLYKLRIRADYKFGSDADTFILEDALKSASYVVRTIGSVLVTGR